MTIQIKLLNDKALMPTRGTEHSAGFDLYAPERVDIPAGASYLVGTGLAMAVPNGWFGQINPRSSMAVKKVRIGARVIDSDYIGEIFVNIHNDGDQVYEIMKGDRIAQIIFMPHLSEMIEVNELRKTSRGDGAFGSTGR